MSVARYIVAGLGAVASVSGVPLDSTTLLTSTSIIGQSTPAPGLPTITQPAAPSAPVNTAAAASAAAANAALAKEVASEVTNVNRFNDLLTVNGEGKELLPEADLRNRVVFDFGARAANLGQGGRFVAANALTFPILNNQGLSTAVAFLNPCGMNSPHSHPRASEFLTVVQGKVKSGFILENGFLANPAQGRVSTEIASELTAFQGTVFPQGSIHYQFNDQCEPATFIAVLNNEDAGTSQIAQNFFFLNDQVVNVTLGEIQNIDGQNIDQFRGTLPANLVSAVDSCLARCNLAPGAPPQPPASSSAASSSASSVASSTASPAASSTLVSVSASAATPSSPAYSTSTTAAASSTTAPGYKDTTTPTLDPASSAICDATGIFCVTLSNTTISTRTDFVETGAVREERVPVGDNQREYSSVALVLGPTITNQALRCQITNTEGAPITVQRGVNVDVTFADGGKGPWAFVEPTTVGGIVCDPAFVADPQ